MKFTTINIQGNVFTSEILDRIRQDTISHQKPQDFGLKPNELVRDEISNAWSLVNTHWQIFKQKRNSFQANDNGVSETRRYWILPLLNQLGYEVALSNAEIVNGKSYAVSHRASNKDGFPIHIVGSEQSLDKRAESGPRLSPHALIQEYINSTDHIYGYVTNGIHFRVLRDATRLSRLSYLEFNLEQMVDEGHYAEFAILYRLLHASRLKANKEEGKDAILEYYHNEALASGSRIRERLSQAVERSILTLANGLLTQNENHDLQQVFENNAINAKQYYLHILRSVYRVLFLLVIEERNLIYKEQLTEEEKKLKDIYYKFYSIQRLTFLVNKAVYVDPKKTDLWQSLLMTFRLFEDHQSGKKLGIDAMGSGIFSSNAIGLLKQTSLNNKTVLEVFRYLVSFENENKQTIRVNYADLDVEEFGSVYEGLLDFEPVVENGQFYFKQGDDRSSSGSHYTPEELVRPLIKHSLDYLIEDKLKEADPEKGLLSLSICDVACGSGHILLSAARRVGFELAKVRSKEDQPTPSVLRIAVRDVIRNCIYGVDLNPLAVELCKVALWLEAHAPGEPLNFLDHRIKCGNAIVGLAHAEELEKGIASEAFKTLPGDEKEVASAFKKRNDLELKTAGQLTLLDESKIDNELKDVQSEFSKFALLPEKTSEQIHKKEKAYQDLTNGKKWWRLKQLADLQVSQFFIPKISDNKEKLTTNSQYMTYLKQGTQILDRGASLALGAEKRFFHWFLEFPEVFQKGGFNCILGNPPYLGGAKITAAFGDQFLNFIKFIWNELGGQSDLIGYFSRRIFELINNHGYSSFISTNSISEGETLKGGLSIIVNEGGIINFAMSSMQWPGKANVMVTLLAITKNSSYPYLLFLNGQKVKHISPNLSDTGFEFNPFDLYQNENVAFKGSFVFGKSFIINDNQSKEFIGENSIFNEIIFDFISGTDLNNSIAQKPSRKIIYLGDLDLEYCTNRYSTIINYLENNVKPERELPILEKKNKGKIPNSDDLKSFENWWKFARPTVNLYNGIKKLKKVTCISRNSKFLIVSLCPVDLIFSDQVIVILRQEFSYFGILQSSIHECWVYLTSSSLGSGLRYTPTSTFATFPFPILNNSLEKISEKYLLQREIISKDLNIGITSLLNLIHDIKNQDQKVKLFRNLICDLDNCVLDSYYWTDIQLRHDFYEVDYLPENDRVRYTIHPEARKEVLKRLLQLNHERYAEEVAAGFHDKKKAIKKSGEKKGTKKEEIEDGRTQKVLFPEVDLFNQEKDNHEN